MVAAANLELAVVVAAEHVEIEGLEQHVAELGVADAGLAILHARADALLGDHLVDGEMLADVAQEIEEADGRRPARVIQQAGGIGGGVEIEQAAELFLDLGDVGVEHFLGEQLALLRLAAGVADGAGGAAGERDGVMAQQLKPAQRQQRHQVAHVQAVGGRVKAAVKRDGARADAFRQLLRVGAIGQQAAPLEFFQNVHPREDRLPEANFQH